MAISILHHDIIINPKLNFSIIGIRGVFLRVDLFGTKHKKGRIQFYLKLIQVLILIS